MRITGVFEVLAEIEEIGARVGDLIVVRPWAERVAVLQHTIHPRWAFDVRCSLFYSDPHLSPPSRAVRHLRRSLRGQLHPPHLRLV